MTKLKRRKRFTTVKHLRRFRFWFPGPDYWGLKKKQKGKVLHKFALHLARSSYDFDNHVKWQFPISSRIQKKIVPSLSTLVLNYIGNTQIKCIFEKSKYYLSLNPFCSGIVHVFLKSAGTNTNFNFTALLSLLFFILTSQKLLLLLHKTKKFLVPFFIVFSVVT